MALPDLSQRDSEISAIAQSITDLADLFKDLSSLVIDQGTLLDRVDYNVEQIGVDVKSAVEELKVATTYVELSFPLKTHVFNLLTIYFSLSLSLSYQKRSGKCQLIFLLLLLISAAIIILWFKPPRPTSSPPPLPPIDSLTTENGIEKVKSLRSLGSGLRSLGLNWRRSLYVDLEVVGHSI